MAEHDPIATILQHADAIASQARAVNAHDIATLAGTIRRIANAIRAELMKAERLVTDDMDDAEQLALAFVEAY